MNNIGVASLLFFITYINVYYELRIANCELRISKWRHSDFVHSFVKKV